MAWPHLNAFLPERKCQVRQETFHQTSFARTGFRWGVELGLGLRTWCVTPALFVLCGMTLVLASVPGVAACGVYGLARGSAIAIVSIAKRRLEERGLVESVVDDGRVK